MSLCVFQGKLRWWERSRSPLKRRWKQKENTWSLRSYSAETSPINSSLPTTFQVARHVAYALTWQFDRIQKLVLQSICRCLHTLNINMTHWCFSRPVCEAVCGKCGHSEENNQEEDESVSPWSRTFFQRNLPLLHEPNWSFHSGTYCQIK